MARPRRFVDVAEVSRLRQLGLSWPAIARKMHLGQGTVFRAYRAAFDPTEPSQPAVLASPVRNQYAVWSDGLGIGFPAALSAALPSQQQISGLRLPKLRHPKQVFRQTPRNHLHEARK